MAEPDAPPPATPALADLLPTPAAGGGSVTLVERRGLEIWQIAAWGAADAAALRPHFAEHIGCPPPETPNGTTSAGEVTVVWSAPRRWLIVADRQPSLCGSLSRLSEGRAALTDLSHARVVVRLAGAEAQSVLAKLCRIDLHPSTFPPGTSAQTLLGSHVAVLIHRVAKACFDLYLPRSYARSAAEALIDAAAEFGGEADANATPAGGLTATSRR